MNLMSFEPPFIGLETVTEDARISPLSARPLPRALPGGPSPEGQKLFADRLLPVLIAKQSVHAIIWNQVLDSETPQFAHGGLFDANDLPKPP